jgi:DNA primase
MLSVDARNALEVASWAYHAQVDTVASYLAGRGISQETAAQFRLGSVVEPMIGDEHYKGRLAIPFLSPTGIVDIRFRSISQDDGPKYLTRPGASSHIYNVAAFQEDTDVIAICEGEIDTMLACQSGVTAVGISGANNWKDWYHRAFLDYRKVLVLCDGDQAGRDLGKRVAQQIDVAVVIHMPDGCDVNDVVLNEGAEGLRKRVGL